VKENLISEGIGVAVELILVYFLINWILNYRERKRWEPVMKLIIYRIERIEGWFCVGLKAISTKEKYKGPVSTHKNQSLHPPKASQENLNLYSRSIQQIQIHFAKLTTLIDLNGANLSSDTAPKLMEVMQQVERLSAMLQFAAQWHSDDTPNHDFIMPSPVPELKKMAENLNDLIKRHNYKVDEHGKDPELRQKTYSAWHRFTKFNKSLTTSPGNYKSKEGTIIYAFDTQTMKALSGIKVGDQIKCYMMH